LGFSVRPVIGMNATPIDRLPPALRKSSHTNSILSRTDLLRMRKPHEEDHNLESKICRFICMFQVQCSITIYYDHIAISAQ